MNDLQFKLGINLSNAAFESPYELARILRELADRIEDQSSFDDCLGNVSIRDINGNYVGMMTIGEGE